MNVLKFGIELDRCGMKSSHLVNSLSSLNKNFIQICTWKVISHMG